MDFLNNFNVLERVVILFVAEIEILTLEKIQPNFIIDTGISK